MSDAKIWFVCAKRTAADVAVGQPFTGECGRWLYTNCLKPLGKRRSDVGLWALDMGNVPCSDNDIVIAVGKPAHKSLGDTAAVSIPHPMAVFKRRDTGETARKIARIAAILKAEEDTQTVFEGSWPDFIPAGGGRFVYQRHDRGSIVHHDLRLESKNSGKSWGWTVLGDGGLDTNGATVTPKAEHTDQWMSQDGQLPNDDTMEILASGTYEVKLCHDKMCELSLKGLTNEDKPNIVVIASTESNDSGVNQWSSTMVTESQDKTLAEITGKMGPDERLIFNGELLAAGSVQTKMLARIHKAEDSKQIVYGVVLDPYIVDAHNDWTPPSEVEKVAHGYVSRHRTVGYMHNSKDDGSTVVESWVEQYPTPEDYKSAMRNEPHKVYARKFGDDVVHSGTWIMGVKLSDELWEQYKSGKLNAFSPGGMGKRETVGKESMPKIEVIDAT